MIRAKIIKDIEQALKDKGLSAMLFNTLFLTKDTIPAIILKDTTDSVTSTAFEVLTHELEISAEVISINWETNNQIISTTLQALKELKSSFNKLELTAINRANIELLDDEYFSTEITLKVQYLSENWSF